MPNPKALTNLVDLLHRALKAQRHCTQNHPQIVQSLESLFILLSELLLETNPLILTFSENRIQFRGKNVEGAPNAAQALSKEMTAHGIHGVAFYQDLDRDELQLLLFVLQLQPQRLDEIGGPTSWINQESHLRIITENRPVTMTRPAPALTPELPTPMRPLPLGSTLPGTPHSPALPPQVPFPIATPQSKAALTGEPDPDERWPSQNPAPTPTVLTNDLRSLFLAAVQMTAVPPEPSARAPWSAEQREIIKDCGFLIPDFTILVGTGAQLELGRIDLTTLRSSLRSALSSLDPLIQGTVVLGLPSFPSEEQALRRALDYLAPELLAQAVAEVHITRGPSIFNLALLVAGLLTCVRDRELTLEAIRGRLQFEDWTLQDLDVLKEAILWECHGTDTKLRMSLKDHGLFGLYVHQVAILNRQLLKSKRTQAIKDLLNQLEAGLVDPEPSRRRHVAEIVADLTECLGEPAILPEMERQIFKMLHGHLEMENDQQAMLWNCQAIEALLGHWILKHQFEVVQKEMLALGDMGFSLGRIPSWKAQIIRDLLLRLSNPLNMAPMVELLHTQEDPQKSKLQELLKFLGRPAAEYLVDCLEAEKDNQRRVRLFASIRAIGRHAVPALKEALTSPQWYLVRNAILLLGEIGHKGAFADVALAMEHRDMRVRKAAIRVVSLLGEKTQAAEAISKILANTTIITQLDCLAVLGDLKSPVCVPAILTLLQKTKQTNDESLRLRLRAVETLGLIGAPEAVSPLRNLFKKKSVFSGRERTSIRLSAAKSLAAINTRESREALALALEWESQEEVRTVLRQYLVGEVST